MQKRPPKLPDPSPADSQTLLINATLFYLILGGIGILVCYYQYDSLAQIFAWPAAWSERGFLLGLGMLAAGVLIILAYLFEDQFISFRSLRQLLMRYMGRLPLWVTLYLAVISSVAEEILFRGAIQPAAGLILTSLLFGLLHLGPTKGISSWSIWAVIAGLLFGWLYQETQSLWPPMIAHILVNSFSMVRFRVEYQRFLIEKQKQIEQAKQQNEQSISGADGKQ